jgi:dihydroorotase
MSARILIKDGLVIDPAQKLEGIKDILVAGGKIAAVGAGLSRQKGLTTPETRVIDAKGKWVLPGLIDMHVHLREPGREGDETIFTGTRAAARGGVTTVLAMPNTEPVIDTPALVRFVYSRARTESLVNVLVSGAVTKAQKGAELAEMHKMQEAGAVAATDDGRPVMNAQVMRRALEYAKAFDFPILDHCEDDHLSAGGVMNEGTPAFAKGVPGIPSASETVMAMRDITLAELTGGRLHLCHVSCAETVELVRQAKKRGVRVTAETAPHYFTLVDEDVPGYDANFKMNPPLRGKTDREAVREGLADGTLEAIATDHAPHAPGKKALGLAAAPFGIIGLETLVPLTLQLVEKNLLSRKAAIDRLTAGPARILGLRNKGTLKPGADGDVTLVDPNLRWVAGDFESKSSNSPFFGRKLKGRAWTALVGGRVVLDEGRLA